MEELLICLNKSKPLNKLILRPNFEILLLVQSTKFSLKLLIQLTLQQFRDLHLSQLLKVSEMEL